MKWVVVEGDEEYGKISVLRSDYIYIDSQIVVNDFTRGRQWL